MGPRRAARRPRQLGRHRRPVPPRCRRGLRGRSRPSDSRRDRQRRGRRRRRRRRACAGSRAGSGGRARLRRGGQTGRGDDPHGGVRRGRRPRSAASGEGAAAVVNAAAEAAADALARTPEQLPVLAAAGVVDAGGQGLVLILEALRAVVDPSAPTAARCSPRSPSAWRSLPSRGTSQRRCTRRSCSVPGTVPSR